MATSTMHPGAHRTGRRRLAGVLAAAALLVAACGGDDDNDSSSATTAGGGSTETTAAVTETTAGGGESTETTAAPSGGDARELVIARDMDINSLDPARAYCDTCQIYLTAVYETLITLDPADLTKQVPRLAESWEANADNTQFTFTLNPKATFADGSPVESKDVKWSWERLANVLGSAAYLMDGYTGIETPDAQTVVVSFKAPNSAFLPIVSAGMMGITNSDVAIEEAKSVAEVGADASDTSEQYYFEQSLGSGPYQLESYTEGDALVLARNDNYWGDNKPVFPSVTIKQVKDAASQLQQLQAGDVDIAMQLSIDSLSQAEGDPNLSISTVDSYNFVYIAVSAGAQAGAGAKELSDPKVREAIKLAIDYQGMLDVTVAGKGKLQASPIPNGFDGSADLPLPAQDLDKAKALMDEAGLADGFTLDAIYPKVNVYGVDFDVMMQKVQQDLKALNIEVNLQPNEFPQWLDTIKATGIPLTAVYFAPDHTDTSQYPGYFGMMDGTPWSKRAGGGAAGAPFINPAEAPLLAEALAASGDAKVAAYTKLGEEMIKDLIFFPMVNPQLVLASQADITGVHYSGCCNLDLALLGVK
jgi:peptide/nickel transport system substrate-binding protein